MSATAVHGPTFLGYCVGCGRDGLEVGSREAHAMKVLCGPCAERPARSYDSETTEPTATATSWAPVGLEPILAGEEIDPEPTMLVRSDGRALIYAGKVHVFQGEPESGKTWVALHLAAERLSGGEVVLYIDFEDGPQSVVGRLLALGAEPDAIRERFRYIRPDEPLSAQGRRDLDAAAEGAAVAILDGVTEAMTLHGWNLQDNTDIAKWLEALPRRLSRRGSAVVELDHVAKDKDGRGRWALGGQHKLAGVDCAYGVAVVVPLGRGREGRLKIVVEKDRPGHVRGFADGQRVADLLLNSDDDGAMTIAVNPPDGAQSDTFRPTFLMERISRALEAQPGLTKRAIRTAVKGRNDAKDLALELLVAEGYVAERHEGKQAVRNYPVRPFREGEEATVPNRAQPCPGRGSQTAPTVPPPLRGHGTVGSTVDEQTVPIASEQRNGHSPDGVHDLLDAERGGTS